MRRPLVSIITPSYNRANFIEGTIDSVASQTYKNIEYLIVDARSADGTADILKNHSAKGTLRYISEPDNGMYDAINKGMSQADGEILAYINTDDRYFPWTVDTAVEHFSTHPEVDIIYGDTLVDDFVHGRKNLNILPSFSRPWLRSGGIIPQPTVFFRRRVFNTIGSFQREVRYLADCEYWLRADQNGMRIQKIHEVLAIEVNHTGTIRQRLGDAVKAEKSLLFETYVDPFFQHSWARILLHRARYVEKELLTLRFAFANRLEKCKGWPQFRTAYGPKLNILQYYTDKLMRTKSDIWRLEAPRG